MVRRLRTSVQRPPSFDFAPFGSEPSFDTEPQDEVQGRRQDKFTVGGKTVSTDKLEFNIRSGREIALCLRILPGTLRGSTFDF